MVDSSDDSRIRRSDDQGPPVRRTRTVTGEKTGGLLQTILKNFDERAPSVSDGELLRALHRKSCSPGMLDYANGRIYVVVENFLRSFYGDSIWIYLSGIQNKKMFSYGCQSHRSLPVLNCTRTTFVLFWHTERCVC